MAKRGKRELLPEEEALLTAVNASVEDYVSQDGEAHISESEARLGAKAHHVPNWQERFREQLRDNASLVKNTAEIWIFKSDPEGVEVLDVDVLCRMIHAQIVNVGLAPQKTRSALASRGPDSLRDRVLKPWSGSEERRVAIRPQLEALVLEVNAKRRELFKSPIEYREVASSQLGSLLADQLLDLDGPAALQFIEQFRTFFNQVIARKERVSYEQLLEELAEWCDAVGARATIQSLGLDPDKLGGSIRALGLRSGESVNVGDNLDALYDFLHAEVQSSTEVGDDEDEGDSDEDVEDDQSGEADDDTEGDLDNSNLDGLEEFEVVDEGSRVLDSPEDSAELPHIKEVRAMLNPTDLDRRAVLENLRTSKDHVNFMRGFFSEIQRQLQLVLDHPEAYTLSQVRILCSAMNYVCDNYALRDGTTLFRKDRQGNIIFAAEFIHLILMQVREKGVRVRPLGGLQTGLDLANEELEAIATLKTLLASAMDEPQSRFDMNEELLSVLTDEIASVPDLAAEEEKVRVQTPVVERLSDVVAQFADNFALKDAEVRSLQNEVRRATDDRRWGELGSLGARASEVEAQLKDIQSRQEAAREELEAAQAELSAAESLITEYGGRREALMEQIQAARGQSEMAMAQIEAHQTAIQLLTEREAVLRETLDSIEFQVSALTQQLRAVLDLRPDLGTLRGTLT